jgi:hypothetical protein
LGSGDVGLAGLILHNAGNEVENVAIVMCTGIDDVDDVEAADGLLGSDLRGIEGGRGFVDIDDLANFLLARDGDIDGGGGRDLDSLEQCVEAFFFDVKFILAGREGRELAASDEIGEAADSGMLRRLEANARGGNRHPVLVGDGNGGSGDGLG